MKRLIIFTAFIILLISGCSTGGAKQGDCCGKTLGQTESKTDAKKEAPADETATKPVVFKAGTYNIHIGKGMDGKLLLDRIASEIEKSGADIIGLQEMDRNVKRSGNTDQFKILKDMLKMEGIFGKSIDLQGGDYGIAIFTKGKILQQKLILHPTGNEIERRSFAAAQIQLENGFICWAINTHLGLNNEDRKAQVEVILDFCKNIKEPVILLGDLNDTPDLRGGIYPDLSASFYDAWRESKIKTSSPEGFTFNAEKPDKRIDYIWLGRNFKWEVLSAGVPETQASDHRPVIAEIKFSGK